jgi:uncharacterized coiled-coil protein SlyX
MTEKVNERLEGLQQEYDKGQTVLADLQAQVTEVQRQLLRIIGAMQVLQELFPDADRESAPESPATTESAGAIQAETDVDE